MNSIPMGEIFLHIYVMVDDWYQAHGWCPSSERITDRDPELEGHSETRWGDE